MTANKENNMTPKWYRDRVRALRQLERQPVRWILGAMQDHDILPDHLWTIPATPASEPRRTRSKVAGYPRRGDR